MDNWCYFTPISGVITTPTHNCIRAHLVATVSLRGTLLQTSIVGDCFGILLGTWNQLRGEAKTVKPTRQSKGHTWNQQRVWKTWKRWCLEGYLIFLLGPIGPIFLGAFAVDFREGHPICLAILLVTFLGWWSDPLRCEATSKGIRRSLDLFS